MPPEIAHELPSDDQLMSELAAGRTEALGEIYLRYGKVADIALQRFAPELAAADREELVQEVFITLNETAVRYCGSAKLNAWIYGIAIRKAQNWRRSLGVRRRFMASRKVEQSSTSWPHDTSPEKAAALRQFLERVLERLPRSQREVLLLHEVEGFSGDEIGRMLDIHVDAVYARLYRARKKLLQAYRKNKGSNRLNLVVE